MRTIRPARLLPLLFAAAMLVAAPPAGAQRGHSHVGLGAATNASATAGERARLARSSARGPSSSQPGGTIRRIGAMLGASRRRAGEQVRRAASRLNTQRLMLQRNVNIVRTQMRNELLLRLGLQPATFQNPVISDDFADPDFEHGEDGALYAYATQDQGGLDNVQVRRSVDNGVTWERLRDALPERALWGSSLRNTWAPHVRFHRGVYYMFFSGQVDHAWAEQHNAGLPPEHHIEPRSHAIGVATSRSARGPFRPLPRPLQTGRNFQAIDPRLFTDPRSGRTIMLWGSSDLGIMARELDANFTDFAPNSRSVQLLRTDPSRPYGRLLEAADMIYDRSTDRYILLASGDNCCGPNARYAVLAATGADFLAPFTMVASAEHPGTSAVLAASARAVAPGHHGRFQIGPRGWMGAHYIEPEHRPVTDQDPTIRPMGIVPYSVQNGGIRVGTDGTMPVGPQRRPSLFGR